MINREFFFTHVRTNLYNGSLKTSQLEGLTFLLDAWDKSYSKKDDRWLAYALATTHHETDRTMRPIEEYGKGKNRPYGKPDTETGHTYYGRGYVQLTWKENYEKMGKILERDLVSKPELALDPAISADIMFEGMIRGSFTGKKLADYFSPTVEDWIRARRIINGTDKANLIADYGLKYYAGISHTT